MEGVATRGAVCFPRGVAELRRTGLDLRDRHAAGEVSRHGLAVARGRLENRLSDLIFPHKTNAANERLAKHLWAHRDDLFTFLRQPGLDATNWRAELAIRFGVILRKGWGGSPTWGGGRDQSVLSSGGRGRVGAVGADVGVAELLATGAFGLGLPESTPSRHAGSAGPASLTRVMAGACTNRSITRPDGRGASESGPERRTRSYSRRGRHYGFSRYEVFAAGPATELVVRLDGRATGW